MPTNKVLFVVSHVKRCEHSIDEVVEVTVTLVLHVGLIHSVVGGQVVEWNVVLLNSNISNKILHITVSSFTQVGQHTVLHLRVVN